MQREIQIIARDPWYRPIAGFRTVAECCDRTALTQDEVLSAIETGRLTAGLYIEPTEAFVIWCDRLERAKELVIKGGELSLTDVAKQANCDRNRVYKIVTRFKRALRRRLVELEWEVAA